METSPIFTSLKTYINTETHVRVRACVYYEQMYNYLTILHFSISILIVFIDDIIYVLRKDLGTFARLRLRKMRGVHNSCGFFFTVNAEIFS